MSGDLCGHHNWREGGATPSSGQRPETLLNILQCTGQAPTTKNTCPKYHSAETLLTLGKENMGDGYSRDMCLRQEGDEAFQSKVAN